MNKRTIKSIISKKINGWFESIDDKPVRELAEKNTIVTGGSIASMLLGEDVNDFDLYFKSKEAVLAVAEYYVKKFKTQRKSGIECKVFVKDDNGRVKIVVESAGIASEKGTDVPYEYFERQPDSGASVYVNEVMQDPGAIEDTNDSTKAAALEVNDNSHRPVFLSTNAITLSGKIQLVLRFYGEPEEIHKNYDFVHCTNYWTSWDRELVLHGPAMECLLGKELRYSGSKYPICSIFRMRKFIKRGWSINAGQILKAVMQISELDLTDIAVLEDQLTGVDVAYFVEVIERLKSKDPEKINAAYLVEIINRMF